MILETIQKVVENPEERFTIITHNFSMGKRVVDLVNHYKHQLDVQIPLESITVVPDGDFSFIASQGTTVLWDNGIMDLKILKELRGERL